jgi:VWFA-related protein
VRRRHCESKLSGFSGSGRAELPSAQPGVVHWGYHVCKNFLFFLPALHSQTKTPPAADPDSPVIHATTREVILDLVVRDKHHHPVTDLRPEEIEVYEDGVKQNVRAFRSIQGAEQLETERVVGGSGGTTGAGTTTAKTASTKPGDAPHALNSLRQVNFVSVVFAGIAPLNLEFARRAVLEFLQSDNLPNTYVTIYRLDRTLNVVQPFTSDKDALAKGVDTAAKGLSAKNAGNTPAQVTSATVAALQANAANILAAPTTGAATAQSILNETTNPIPALVKDPLWAANAASQDASIPLGSALLVQADLEKGLRFVDSLSGGMDAMDSLHELVRSEEKLPGRKVVLYLADGLIFPVNRRDAVDNLISYANRAGVAFYTIDTRGLNVDDPVMEALSLQKRTGAESSVHVVDPHTQVFEDDDVQLTAVASGQLAMRELAEATGGIAVTNTNEISIPMQHMMEDIRTHYELAYSPTSTVYDGHFRKIEVKISRPKVTFQTRKGYFAVPDLNGEPLQPFELVALNSMNASPAPAEFPYQVAAMKFRPGVEGVEYEVTFEIPLSALKTLANAKTGKSHAQAALVALIHDGSGAVVGKVSRELAREAPTSEWAQMGNDRILYAEPIELRPGHYVVDAAVTDELGGKTSVKRFSVFVAPTNSLAVSSLQLVRRFDPMTVPHELLSPFDLENGHVTPTLVGSVSSGSPVSLYFVVYPAKVAAEDLKVTLDLLQDGRKIARKPLNLGAPGVDGSIPMVVQLSPGPGHCDVLVTAQQGTAVAQSSFSVSVE